MNRFIRSTDPTVRYSGRIDTSTTERVRLVFPYSSAAFRFTGTSLGIRLINRRAYYRSFIGAMIDGREYTVPLTKDDESIDVTIASKLPAGTHTVTVFKRQDGSHYLDLQGFLVDETAEVLPPTTPKPTRRMEVYGDSVSAGEVSEAVAYAGKPDPEHDGQYSNSWYSYAAMTARNLNAELHDIAQGGVSLLDGIGWFNGPDYVGMESIFDKIDYNPSLGPTKQWDFSQYDPQVIVVALGQNDAHPDDFMTTDYQAPISREWRAQYATFLRKLRSLRPHALIICATTILEHDASWDTAIGDAVRSVGDPKIVHFLYSLNGRGTPGHIRIPEAYGMASELTAFIRSFGEGVWES